MVRDGKGECLDVEEHAKATANAAYGEGRSLRTWVRTMCTGNMIPVVCLAPDSVSAYYIFNPNNWSGQSRAIVQSCAASFGVMKHNVQKIHELCLAGKEVCCPRFGDLGVAQE